MSESDRRRAPNLGDESLDGVLRAVFADVGDAESILAAVGRMAGDAPRILLREGADEPSPVLTAHAKSGPEAVEDDARYQVLGEIARGGVGVVYKARDRDLGRSVALKVLRSEHADNPDVLERFVEEAQIEGQLQHPGVVPVYGLGMQPDGRPCFAMKLVRGETLAARLQGRAEPAEDRHGILAVFESVCQAIAYAHARGVVHRDLKPANVMIGAHGEVQVMDWGFAKVLGREPRRAEAAPPATTIVATVRTGSVGSASIAGSVMGTPAYMPPEQALGRVDELDERSDVFALGAILCEILTGLPPYAGEPEDLLVMAASAQQQDAHRRLDECGADEALVELTTRCLAPVRTNRPRHAGEVADAIHEFLAVAEERVRVAAVRAAAIRAEGAEETARLARSRLATETLEARAAEERAEAERQARLVAKEMRRGAAARRARIGILAAAAGLALAVVLGGTGWLRAGHERAAREREIEARVSEALRRAGELEGEGELGPAAEAAMAAAALAADAGTETKDRATALAARIEAAREAAEAAEAQRQRNRKMVQRLEEARLARLVATATRPEEETFASGAGSTLDDPATDAAFTAAFREYGIDVETLDPAEAAERVAVSSIRDALVAAIDEWAWLRHAKEELSGWERLHAIARRADPDPLRNELRDAVLAESRERLLALEDRIVLPDADPRTLDRLGSALSNLRDWPRKDTLEAGIRVLRAASRLRPGDFWIRQHLAGALYWLRRYDQSLRHQEAAVALQPRSAYSRARLAWTYFYLGEHDRAIEQAHRALELDEWCADALTVVAATRRRLGDREGALRSYRKAVEGSPGNPRALWNLAQYLLDAGDHEGAEEWYRKALRVDPFSGESHVHLAWCLRRRGKLEEAIRCYREATRLRPESFATPVNLAFALQENRQYAEAVKLMQSALEKTPGNARGQTFLASALLADGRIEEAEHLLRLAIEKAPEEWRTLFVLGLLLVEKGNLRDARDAFIRAVRADPGARSFNNLGWIHDVLRDYAPARAAYEEAHRLLPDATHAGNLAHAWLELGRPDRAIETCRKALDGRPDWTAVRGRLAEALEATGDLDGALAQCDRALADGPEDPEVRLIHTIRAKALLGRGRILEAVKAMRVASEADERIGLGESGALPPRGRARIRQMLDTWEATLPFASRFDAIAAGDPVPTDAAQAVSFGLVCRAKGRSQAATRLFREACERDPDLLFRFDFVRDEAVAGAVVTGTRAGRDQALAWLRVWMERLPPVGEASLETLITVRNDSWNFRRSRHLAPVRDALESLPEEEREGWRDFWKAADEVLRRALARKE